jgi:hypothetical protein
MLDLQYPYGPKDGGVSNFLLEGVLRVKGIIGAMCDRKQSKLWTGKYKRSSS